ncbi:MAG: DUF1257 domain-containing protein [Planctomycetota bacterium]|nr:MAG: DUF1257 domain-containing protein [Planctomycetota bacterium]
MSHVVQIETQVRDLAAVRAACRRLGLPQPERGTVTFFDGTATGWAVRLPGWQYPVVLDPESGRIHFDDYNGRWGDRRRLDAFLQAYAVEKTRREARRRGYRVTERALPDGSIQLRIEVGE